jgi:hypothetical protein
MSKEIEKAKKLLEDEAKKKQEEFLKEYRELCLKHGMEIVAVPSLGISPIK